MKILFVEDSPSFSSDLDSRLQTIPHVSEVKIVGNKATALAEIESTIFDLIILDLSIPLSSSDDVPAPEHGQEVFHRARSTLPGTPIFILTGSDPDKFTRNLAQLGNQVEIWGDRSRVETVRYCYKEDANEMVDRITQLATSLHQTNAIFLNMRGKDLQLTAPQVRMLKSFARRANGVACDVVSLGGGLSDARVFKAIARDEFGHPQAFCAAKIGKHSSISKEQEAFENHVKKLSPQSYAPVYCYMDSAVGLNGGIFYTLTDADTVSLFEKLHTQAQLGPDVVRRVRDGLHRWTVASSTSRTSIASMRAAQISGESYEKIAAQFDLARFLDIESTELYASQSCIHGDLHCGNVLVKPTGEAILIDYGDAGFGYTCADPITLELSLVFHPDAQKFGLSDDLHAVVNSWPNIDSYAEASPIKEMIQTCREWSHDAGGGDLAVLGQAYSFGVRQLKYDTVDRTITLSFIEAVVKKIREN